MSAAAKPLPADETLILSELLPICTAALKSAEQLLGMGDMLFMPGAGRIQRVHGPFVSDEEVERVVKTLKDQAEPVYVEAVTADPDGGKFGMPGTGGEGAVDDGAQVGVEGGDEPGGVAVDGGGLHVRPGGDARDGPG